MNAPTTLQIPRAPRALSVALILVLSGTALLAVQGCTDPPAPKPPTTSTPTPPKPPTTAPTPPAPYPPPPT